MMKGANMKKHFKLGTILLASLLLAGCTQTSTPSIDSTPSMDSTEESISQDSTSESPSEPLERITDISEVYNGEDEDTFVIQGVVAQFLYGSGGTATSFYMADATGSMLVYSNNHSLSSLKIGYTVKVAGYLDHYQSSSDAAVGQEIGYYGAIEIVATDDIMVIDTEIKEIPTTAYTEVRIKDIVETSYLENDLTTKFFKVKSTIQKVANTGYTNYYFNDLSMDDSIYVYTTNSGSDYAWLDTYDGQSREAIVAVHSMHAKNRVWRIVPIQILDEVTASDADIAGFALDRLEKQVGESYTATVSIELVKQDEKLLSEATITYTTNKETQTITESTTGDKYLLNINGEDYGTFTLTITLVYKEVEYTRNIEILVRSAVGYDTITIAEVKAASEGEEVLVEGIYVKFTANYQGLYITDSTGILVVNYLDLDLNDYKEGEKMIFTGTVTLDYATDNGSYAGHNRLANAELLEHDSIVHEWDKTIVTGTTTVSELYKNPDLTKITNIYLINGYVELYEDPRGYYTNWRIYDPDGGSYMSLYCANSGQLSWLQDYVNQTLDFYVYVRDTKTGSSLRIEVIDIVE